METFQQKVRGALLIVAGVLVVVGVIRAWGHVGGWDLVLLAGGGFLLGLVLRSSGGAKRPMPPAQPTPKSGA